jgi:OFA family oxalate/formate antiporter-like MFS transporter
MLIQKQDIPKKGLLSGVMLFAFGLSSVIFSPIARQVIDTYSLSTLFYLYAAVSFVVTLLLYLVLPTFKTEHIKHQTLSIPPWGKYLFLLTSMSFVGLMMIGLTNVIATSNYALDPVMIATFISIFALLNAISRPIFGYLMDHFTFKKLALISIGLIIAASLVNFFNQGQSLILFFVGYGLYWFNLGVWLTMMPLYVKREVGTTLYAAVYGKVYLGYGISAVIGTLLSSLILDTLGDPRFLYMLIVGWMVIMSIYIVFGLNKKSA